LSKLEQNKEFKEKALFNSAYELFLNKGIRNTAISDIVKKAGVAKGTFYLYFKDKYDICDKIIIEKSSELIKEAYKAVVINGHSDYTETIIAFTDYIIEYLKQNVVLLTLVHKNLSWGLFKKAIADERDKEIELIYEYLKKGLEENGLESQDLDEVVFMIVELIGSICYSSIIHNEPREIGEMKPILYRMIRKMVRK